MNSSYSYLRCSNLVPDRGTEVQIQGLSKSDGMEHSVLAIRLSDRIRNALIRSKTGITEVGNKTARLKWDWAGHVCSIQQDRWARVITQWVPDDRRRCRGRPRKRWRTELDAFMRFWPEKAIQRKEEAMAEALPAVGQNWLKN